MLPTGGGTGILPGLLQGAGFRALARGACAADPGDVDSQLSSAKAQYLSEFFAVAPKQCFKFENGLLNCKFNELRGVFLAANRGSVQFNIFNALYLEQRDDIFREVLSFF
mmetsp:Transcript_150857/g.484831  ORF Transcript_150857/g.484831 Transcript_150857/m.484831 type:complete len:110 (-) Transcript_150857:170-499(-)